MAKDDKPHTRDAVLQPLGPCPSGDHHHGVLWEKDGTSKPVMMEPAGGGPSPPDAERVRFVGRRGDTPFYDVQVTSRRGPPKVNSEAYKEGWERIFGNKAPVGEA